MAQVRVTVDGVNYADDVEPRTLLVYYLRERLGKTGTVVGCDTSNCGACTVHLNGRSVKSCSVLAVQADGGEVTTIEGVARDGNLHPVIGYDPAVPAELDAAHVAFGRVIALAITLDGSASGEHGIGVLKRRWLADELGDDQWELQRQITRVFDPAGILNPGKVFER